MAESDPYPCPYCGKTFKTKRAMQGHKNLQCDQKGEDGTVSTDGDTDSTSPEQGEERAPRTDRTTGDGSSTGDDAQDAATEGQDKEGLDSTIDRAQKLKERLKQVREKVSGDEDDDTGKESREAGDGVQDDTSTADIDTQETPDSGTSRQRQQVETVTVDPEHVGAGPRTSGGRKETEIGTLKIVQEDGKAPQLHISMGAVEIPFRASFQMKRDGNDMVLEAMDPGDPRGVPMEETALSDHTDVSDEPSPGQFGEDLDTGSSEEAADQERVAQMLGMDVDSGSDTDTGPQPDSLRTEGTREKLSDRYGISSDVLRQLRPEQIEKLDRRMERREDLKEEIDEQYDVDDAEITGKSLEELQAMKERLQKAEELKEEIAEEYAVDTEDMSGATIEDLRELKERLDERQDLKERLIENYGIDEDELLGRSFDELQQLREQKQKEKELRKEIEQEFGQVEQDLEELDLETLQVLRTEKAEERDELLDELEEHGYSAEDVADHGNKELKEMLNKIKRKKRLKDHLVDEYDIARDELEGASLDDLEEMHETLQHIDELQTDLIENHGLEKDEIEGLNLDDLEALHRRMEKTEELREELREEYDIPDKELDKRDLEELEELHNHLQEIEQQRNELLNQYGLGDDGSEEDEDSDEDEEDGDSVRPEVKDLSDQIKKLRGRPEASDIDADEDADGETDKEVEKGKSLMEELNLLNLKQEYEHEIEDYEDEDVEEEGPVEEAPGLLDRVRQFFGSGGPAGGTQESTVYEAAKSNLERAQEIDEYEESTVLLAHTLKQFLELKLHIRKEMTYMEFIRTLEEREESLEQQLTGDDVDELKRFFRKMHLQQYKGEKKVDFHHAYELANTTIEAFAE